MARVSIYLNFPGTTEEAFNHYAQVFGTDVSSLQRMGSVPTGPGEDPLPAAEQNLIMHIELPILAGAVLMGTDVLESRGQELRVGNNVTINLEPDTLEETQRLFDALSEGGSDSFPLQPMFWGSHWGTCLDRYGIRWMFNFTPANGE